MLNPLVGFLTVLSSWRELFLRPDAEGAPGEVLGIARVTKAPSCVPQVDVPIRGPGRSPPVPAMTECSGWSSESRTQAVRGFEVGAGVRAGDGCPREGASAGRRRRAIRILPCEWCSMPTEVASSGDRHLCDRCAGRPTRDPATIPGVGRSYRLDATPPYELRPRSAGRTALTPAPRTLVQTGSCRRCSLIHPLHVVVDVPSRMTLFRATADTAELAIRGFSAAPPTPGAGARSHRPPARRRGRHRKLLSSRARAFCVCTAGRPGRCGSRTRSLGSWRSPRCDALPPRARAIVAGGGSVRLGINPTRQLCVSAAHGPRQRRPGLRTVR